MQKISHRETAAQRSTRYDGGNNKEHKQTESLNTQEETGAEGRRLGETNSWSKFLMPHEMRKIKRVIKIRQEVTELRTQKDSTRYVENREQETNPDESNHH